MLIGTKVKKFSLNINIFLILAKITEIVFPWMFNNLYIIDKLYKNEKVFYITNSCK